MQNEAEQKQIQACVNLLNYALRTAPSLGAEPKKKEILRSLLVDKIHALFEIDDKIARKVAKALTNVAFDSLRDPGTR